MPTSMLHQDRPDRRRLLVRTGRTNRDLHLIAAAVLGEVLGEKRG
jgi:hypothetical protein